MKSSSIWSKDEANRLAYFSQYLQLDKPDYLAEFPKKSSRQIEVKVRNIFGSLQTEPISPDLRPKVKRALKEGSSLAQVINDFHLMPFSEIARLFQESTKTIHWNSAMVVKLKTCISRNQAENRINWQAVVKEMKLPFLTIKNKWDLIERKKEALGWPEETKKLFRRELLRGKTLKQIAKTLGVTKKVCEAARVVLKEEDPEIAAQQSEAQKIRVGSKTKTAGTQVRCSQLDTRGLSRDLALKAFNAVVLLQTMFLPEN